MLFVTKPPVSIPDEHVHSLNINGMKGRMVKIPAKKKNLRRKILLVYGMHTSLERMYSTAKFLSRYGEVTMPDLPGFGGMDSLYSIGKKASVDNFADYLRTFIRFNYKKQKFSIIAMSNGFEIATRMLQKYPVVADRVSLLVSFVGFGRPSDFKQSVSYRNLQLATAKFFSTRPMAAFLKYSMTNRFTLGLILDFWFFKFNNKDKHEGDADKESIKQMELYLWSINDMRTRAETISTFFTCDLIKTSNKPIPLKVINLTAGEDQWFKTDNVRTTLAALYEKYEEHPLNLKAHAPSLVANESEVAKIIPKEVTKILES